jgi:hypothetical protein
LSKVQDLLSAVKDKITRYSLWYFSKPWTIPKPQPYKLIQLLKKRGLKCYLSTFDNKLCKSKAGVQKSGVIPETAPEMDF